jgi:hypothetical protein
MITGTFKSFAAIGVATALMLGTAVPGFAAPKHHRANADSSYRGYYNYAPNNGSTMPGGADAVQPVGPPDPASCEGFRC